MTSIVLLFINIMCFQNHAFSYLNHRFTLLNNSVGHLVHVPNLNIKHMYEKCNRGLSILFFYASNNRSHRLPKQSLPGISYPLILEMFFFKI